MAPKPTGTTPAGFDRSGSAHSRVAMLAWRVGRSGLLQLALHPSDDARAFEAELRLETRSGRSASVSMQLCGSAQASVTGDEYHLALRLERGEEPVVAEIALVRRGGCPDARDTDAREADARETDARETDVRGTIVLTDLPARLGLRGGTYLLDPASGAACLDALLTP